MSEFTHHRHPSKWEDRFLNLASHVATWSKDPSTQLGAVIVRDDNTIVSLGFNGLPRNIRDDERLENRDIKYEIIVHGEMNAMITSREPLHGHILFTFPLPPCSRCAAVIIQSGIKRVISVVPEERWFKNCYLGASLLQEAGITSVWYAPDVLSPHPENSLG